MTLVLRQVSQRAGGGEIVRTVALDGPSVMIGRDPACDIHLTDLAVGLRHAKLTETGPGQLLVEAVEGETFRLNGKKLRRAELDVAAAPVLTVGEFEFTFTTGEAAGEMVIGLAKAEQDRAPDERAVFASPLGRRRLAWLFGLIILSVCLALPIAVFHSSFRGKIPADRQWSGGHLSESHAFLEENCTACHVEAFKAVPDTACKSCHTDELTGDARRRLADEVRAMGSPFTPLPAGAHASHARLEEAMPRLHSGWTGEVEQLFRKAFDRPTDRCVSCHLEHEEEAAPAPSPKGAVLPIGTPVLEPTATCQGCHAQIESRLKDTRLTNVIDWGDHPDFRPMVIVQPGDAPVKQRAVSRDMADENSGLIFSHALHLAAGGSVARMGAESSRYSGPMVCADCHRPSADAKTYLPIEMERDCGACHSLAFAEGPRGVLPHGDPAKVTAMLRAFYQSGGPPSETETRRQPGLLAELRARVQSLRPRAVSPAQVSAGVRAAFSQGGQCYGCHAVVAPQDGSLNFKIAQVSQNQRYVTFAGAFDHSLAAHRQTPQGAVGCAGCHAAEASSRAEQVLMPKVEDCAGCHGKAKTEVKLAAPANCETCHSYHAPALPTRRERGGLAGPAG